MLSILSRCWQIVGPLSLLLLPISAWAVDWRPITPAELRQKTPKVEASADAEVIFWDVKIEDRYSGGDFMMILNHYLRVKVFTDRGKEKFSTVEIEHFGKRRIGDVKGRTIKPDGTIIDLKKDAIFERELAKTKGFKARGTTFALPNVEVGDIVEYQYREYRDNELANYLPLQFQREVPMWEVTYHLKPLQLPWLTYGMRSMGFRLTNTPFKQELGGFYFTTMTDIPSFKDEALAPPDEVLRSWLLVYYEEDNKMVPEKFWKDIGKADWNKFKPLLKVDNEVKRRAAELTTGAPTDEAKLIRLDAFCRNKIKNTGLGESEMTSAERKAIKENRNPGDTLKQMAGTSTDIDLAFAALATAAGFDARFARIPDRGVHFFSKEVPIQYFLRNNYSVAVNVSDKWHFYDPATKAVAPGTIRWREEGQPALISDPKGGFFEQTQFSPASASMRKRDAKLKLNDEGEIEGTIEYIYTGHIASDERNRYEGKTAAEIEEDWKARLGNYGSPVMTDFQVLQKDDPELPMIVRMKITASGFCARTGKRILLEPAFFEHNSRTQFTETNRKYDIYFHYAYSEEDDVEIELPEGWVLDKPTAPTSSKLSDVGHYEAKVRVTTDKRKVLYSRKFSWGTQGTLIIPGKNYSNVKNIFDFVQEQDHHVLTLTQEGAGGGN